MSEPNALEVVFDVFGRPGTTARVVTCLRTYRPPEPSPRIERGTVAEVCFEGRLDFGEGQEPGVRLKVKSVPFPAEVAAGRVFEIRRGTFEAWWR